MADTDSTSDSAGKKSFWETLPGLLTGIAAVLSALAGLLTVLHYHGASPAPASETPAVEHTSTPTHIQHAAPINVGGIWHDVNYGAQIQMKQVGNEVYSETYDPISGQRLAVGSGRISGRSLEGPYRWMNGSRFIASLRISEDGKEITGTSRNVVTGQIVPAHLVR